MSGLAYLIDALGGLAGGFAQNYNPVSNQADNDVGNALAALYGGSTGAGGGTGGSGPGGMGGGSYQYQGQAATDLPSAAPGGMGAGPLTQAQAPSQPKVAQAPAPGSPQGNAANGGNYGYGAPPQPQGGQGMPSPVGATNQSQGAPVAPQGQGASATIGRGPLTLPNLVAAIRQRNPNISGRHLAAAVTKALPLLNAAGLEQYRQLGLQLREQNQQNIEADRADRSADRKQGMRDRLQIAQNRIDEQNSHFNETMQFKIKSLQEARNIKAVESNARDLHQAIKAKLESTEHEIQMSYLDDNEKQIALQHAKEDAKYAEQDLNNKLKAARDRLSGKTDSENTQATSKGAQGKAAPKVDNAQKSSWKKQAQETMAQHPEWADKIKAKYKELTGEDLGQ